MGEPQSQADRLARAAALDEPLRRRMYLHMKAEPGPLSRDQAAGRFGVSRAVAAFHLDKLADLGVLEVEFRRPPGRGGPGAGRPTKLYRASTNDVSVSIPPREYELAGRLLAEAVSTSTRLGTPVVSALGEAARRAGRALGKAVTEESGDVRAEAALGILASCGYEPDDRGDTVALTNCPFHALAQDYRDLVCGMNLALIAGLTEELGTTDLEARLDPRPGACCVRLIRRPGPEAAQS